MNVEVRCCVVSKFQRVTEFRKTPQAEVTGHGSSVGQRLKFIALSGTNRAELYLLTK